MDNRMIRAGSLSLFFGALLSGYTTSGHAESRLPLRFIVTPKLNATTAYTIQSTSASSTQQRSQKRYIVTPNQPQIDAKSYQQYLQTFPDVAQVEIDTPIYPTALAPNDALYAYQQYAPTPSQLNVSTLNLEQAWQEVTGSAQITVGIIDSGITAHSDLNANLVGGKAELSGYDFISQAYYANDNDGRDSNPSDSGNAAISTWHGTHIAGTIAALGNNGIGVAGVNWHSQLLNLRVLGKQGGYISDMIDAIYWAIGDSVPNTPLNTHPAKVLNLSVGGTGICTPSLQQAINAAVSKGVTLVTAAGNDNQGIEQQIPANCEHVIVVGALAQDGRYASFSNYGLGVDVAAPGVDIWSTSNSGTDKPAQESYKSESGTSMSTAEVTGVIALMLAANNHLSNGDLDPALIPALLESKLKRATRPFPSTSGCTNLCGAGMVDAYQAVKAVNTAPTAVISAPSKAASTDLVVITGNTSYDDPYNTTSLSYHWQQIAGPIVTLTTPENVDCAFLAPSVSGTVQLRLTVRDDVGLSHSSEVSIVINSASTNPTVQTAGTTSTGGGGAFDYLVLIGLGLMLLFRVFGGGLRLRSANTQTAVD